MTHVEQGELQAYLDDEVTLAARAHIETHLRDCSACRAELERQRAAGQLFASVLHSSDIVAPTLPALAAVSAARGDVARRRFALSRSALAKAAIFVVGFAALATAAIPGSPVRQWISSALQAVGIVKPAQPLVDTNPTAVVPASPEPVTGGEAAALAIAPVGGRVLIVLTNVSAEAVIRVHLVDSDRATVQTLGEASHARFRTSAGRIEVIGVRNGTVRIDLPRSLEDGRVQVDGRTLFQKDHAELRLKQPATTGADSEFVFKAGQ